MELDYKNKSYLVITTVLVLMFGIGFLTNYFNPGLTGGATAETVACTSNLDCNDGISCTEDICHNGGTIDSFCTHKPVDYCEDNDGCCPTFCSEEEDNDCK